ncbi:anthranilate synthase component I [Limobrevibacterium gyesilva]|uniref:Anthranilate synthase component 1 n=1 Tax=Limobrevibacterium gyesilva TaxID=2991712 RepID=A0AA41YMV4_9PROT|nr:anthranilate synthase component I [Limobrevibacterium gyesilva]MCW3475436.1 anthranilate synthase component I [Limobrevibacterium gyesilva]
MNAAPPPGFAEFRQDYEQGRGRLLWTRGVADLETPVAAFLKLAHGKPNTFLLESVEGGATRGRYSIIGLEPDLIWRCRTGRAEINRDAHAAPYAFTPDARAPLDSLRALVAESRLEVPDFLPPMCGGLIGYLGYDMIRQIEKLPARNQDDIGTPEALLARPTLYAIFDNVTDLLTLAAPVYPRAGVTPAAAWESAQSRLATAEAALARPLPLAAPPVALPPLPEPESTFTKQGFTDAVLRAKEYIAAGDAFQIVLSQRFAIPFALPPLALYRALRRINPAPFLFFLDFGGFSVVGSSPEILVRLRDGTVTIRPLAGTRRRGATHEEDQALEHELLNDPKERAEHLMLLDLGRNDVGRVAELGSVRVTESFAIERFSHVMHIMSDVQGKLAEGLDAIDALAAGFPAGTLSGAPKVRAMEIIEELEPVRRGIYAGCIGYFAANGTMDTCIALRTAVVKDGTMYVQAGAGIVADSDPDAEYEETRQKARALFRAAEEAVRFAAGKGA